MVTNSASRRWSSVNASSNREGPGNHSAGSTRSPRAAARVLRRVLAGGGSMRHYQRRTRRFPIFVDTARSAFPGRQGLRGVQNTRRHETRDAPRLLHRGARRSLRPTRLIFHEYPPRVRRSRAVRIEHHARETSQANRGRHCVPLLQEPVLKDLWSFHSVFPHTQHPRIG